MPKGTHYKESKRISRSSAKKISDIKSRIKNSFIVKKSASNPIVKRLIKDKMFRAVMTEYFSLCINSLYAVVQLCAGIIYSSVWFGALAVYNILLAFIRFLLLRPGRPAMRKQSLKSELKKYRLCGVVLLLMTPVFASILILVVHKNSGAEYHGILIYLAAIYSFCKITAAISNARKFRNSGHPVMTAAKIISLIAALISVLSLETAILSRFGNMNNPAFYQGMIGTVGGAVCVFVLVISIYMVVYANRQLKRTE